MGLWRDIQQRFLTTPTVLSRAFGLGGDYGGKVTPSNPGLSALYRCITLIADHIATLPISVPMKGESGWERSNHPLQKLLQTQPDVYLNSVEWRLVLMYGVLGGGNTIFVIHKAANGFVTRLEYIPIDNVSILQDQDTREVFYEVRRAAGVKRYEEAEVLHFKAFAPQGLWGVSPIDLGATSMGMAAAALETLNQFYTQGAIPSGILSIKGTIRDQARLRELGEQFDSQFSVFGKSKTATLTEGAEYKPLQMTGRDAQLVETLNFGVQDVARWYGVPLNKLSFEGAGSAGAGIEAEDHGFIVDTLKPWVEKVEMEMTTKLLPPGSPYRVVLDMSELQRGSMGDQIQLVVSLANIGAITLDEVRERFGLPSVPGGNQLITLPQYSPQGDIENGTKNREEDEESGETSGNADD